MLSICLDAWEIAALADRDKTRVKRAWLPLQIGMDVVISILAITGLILMGLLRGFRAFRQDSSGRRAWISEELACYAMVGLLA